MASFFYYGCLSSAQLDRWQAPTQWPIIDQTAYHTNSWLVRLRNRSWIKGLGKNPQKSELIHCLQCLLSRLPNHKPMDSEKRLRVYKSSATMARHVWRVDKAPAKTHKTHKTRNAHLDALRSNV